MPSEITWDEVPSTAVETEYKTPLEFQVLIAEVQSDQWDGTTEIDRATSSRAQLFSRLRFPFSSIGKSVKERK